MIGYIYCYKNTINGKVYIGQTYNIKRRKREHLSKSNRDYREKFYNATRKYGFNNFSFSILYTFYSKYINRLTILLDAIETFLIKKFDSYNNGYNSTLGGHSKRGYTLSDEFKEKCRSRKHSLETRKKMSSSAHNKVVSEATKEKLRNIAITNNSYKYIEPFKNKMLSNRRKALIKPIIQLDRNGVLIKEWESLTDASKSLKIDKSHISKCCSKLRKTAGGYMWRYK